MSTSLALSILCFFSLPPALLSCGCICCFNARVNSRIRPHTYTDNWNKVGNRCRGHTHTYIHSDINNHVYTQTYWCIHIHAVGWSSGINTTQRQDFLLHTQDNPEVHTLCHKKIDLFAVGFFWFKFVFVANLFGLMTATLLYDKQSPLRPITHQSQNTN